MAAERGQPKSVRALARLGADERPTQQRHTAGVLGSDTGARGDSPKCWWRLELTRRRSSLDGMETKITALQLAVCQGKLDAIRLLAQCGANVDASTDDDDGNKAVHLTAMNNQVDVDGS